MQILQRLFKIAPQEPPNTVKKDDHKDQTTKSKGIVVVSSDGRRHHKRVETSKLNCDDLLLFRFLQRKDVSKPYFYHTLNLKAVGCCFQRRRHPMKKKKKKNDDRDNIVGICDKADSASHVGNKVLPITDISSNIHCKDSEKKAKVKGDQTKPISRIKELMRWAAFGNGHNKSRKYGIGNKMLNLKNQAALKTVSEDDHDNEPSNESPKISFRWDMESCTTSSSVYSAISKASFSFKNDHIENGNALDSTIVLHVTNQCSAGTGYWITTDSEFVVLEL